MTKTTVSRTRLSFQRKIFLVLASLALGGGFGPLVRSQTIGYSPVADDDNDNIAFAAFSPGTAEVYVIPFTFNSIINGDYSLSSTQLLLSGNANLADFSIYISSVLA